MDTGDKSESEGKRSLILSSEKKLTNVFQVHEAYGAGGSSVECFQEKANQAGSALMAGACP
jgi:hypothetical protein